MKRIAIISPNLDVYSETFIQAHIELLEGDKYLLYGAYKPVKYREIPIVKILSPIKRFILKYFYGADLLDESIKLFLRRERINIILAEYGPTGCAMLKIAKDLNIPLIVHFHGFDASSNKIIEEYKKSYLELFSYASSIIAVSKQMQESLIRIGADPVKIVYAPYGPASMFADNLPDYEKSDSALFIGRFVNKKAPYLLIEVMKIVRARGYDFKLIMAGDGTLLETCKTLVKINGLQKNFDFTGAVSHREVNQLMQRSFCYIQHSITTEDGEKEGTPVTILEASQAGLPVISTRHAGIPDVIVDGVTGFLVDELDINTMADHLISLYSNRKLAEEMGLKGRKRIKEEFPIEKHISILNREIDKTLNGN